MENFAYPVKNFKPISVYAKSLHLRCLKGFWMRLIAPGNVLCHHNKLPMRYFELLYGSRIIYLSLKYFRKIAVTTSLRKARRCRDSLPSSLLVRTGTTTNFSFRYQSCTSSRSGPFCWQKPCCGCSSGIIDLVVFFEYTFFSTVFQHQANLLSWQDSKKLCKPSCCRSNQPLSKLLYFFVWCALLQVTTFLFSMLLDHNDSTFANPIFVEYKCC